MEPIFATFWINFGALLGFILQLKSAPEGDQKWDHFWNHVAPALRGSGVAFPGILREVWKGYWNWNYTLQGKGRDIHHDVPAHVLRHVPPFCARAFARTPLEVAPKVTPELIQ